MSDDRSESLAWWRDSLQLMVTIACAGVATAFAVQSNDDYSNDWLTYCLKATALCSLALAASSGILSILWLAIYRHWMTVQRDEDAKAKIRTSAKPKGNSSDLEHARERCGKSLYWANKTYRALVVLLILGFLALSAQAWPKKKSDERIWVTTSSATNDTFVAIDNTGAAYVISKNPKGEILLQPIPRPPIQ